MMKKILFTFLTVCLALTVQAQDMTLEEVLENHFEVINQEKRSDINTLVYEGTMTQGIEIPVKLIIKRPGMVRMEGSVQGKVFVQAYDGNDGFMIMPNAAAPQDLSDEQKENMKDKASVDSELKTAQDKEFDMELMGTEDFEGSDVYLVKVTKDNGDATTYYIDAENYVILKARSKTTVQGQEVVGETYYSNYKEVDGMIFPHSFDYKNAEGQTMNQIMIETVTLDSEVSDEQFARPE
ncbi:outer membrane lipoprotein-sorting protein [Roseivirga sp. BDSF3-8]|uniref:outer membrane lipoprotein-sorting protein n=1 Tax=Roseivirga sp. BDSF3-8 TaxID=3241598 RepID=UPI00353245F2